MTRLAFTLSLATLLLACQAAPADGHAADPGKPLNVVVFLVDDYGWTDVSYNGSTFYETPNIDRLAATGMAFTDGYAACPVCSPTRAAIMSGKYPHRMDTTDWFGAPQPEAIASGNSRHWTRNKPLLPASYVPHLPLEEVTIAEALKEHGYATFFAGKWHLGPNPTYYPEAQGFDINKGGYFRGGPYGGGKYFAPFTGMPNLEDTEEGRHLPAVLAEHTANFITDSKDKPFLAYLSFYSVHTPIIGRPDLIEYYREKKQRLGLDDQFGDEPPQKVRLTQAHAVYAAMIHAMDEAVGVVLDTLDDQGLADHTIVIFTADNGGLSTAEGSPTSNLPLRAGKGWIYEGGIREPTIVRLPGHAAGETSGEPVTSTDFYPTILDAAGLPLRPDQHMDGVSLVPLLTGEADTLDREAIYWHYPHYGNQGGSPASAVRAGDWKLIEWYEPGKGLELYNLRDDIGEQNNLVNDEPEIAEKLHAMLKQNLRELDAKMNEPNPNAQ